MTPEQILKVKEVLADPRCDLEKFANSQGTDNFRQSIQSFVRLDQARRLYGSVRNKLTPEQ
jgi:hypothetical protein